jgi:hypothetical protein
MEETPIRKQFIIDYDARRKPRTRRFCVKCQKDLDPGKHVRRVYVTRDMEAVHPDDLERYPRSNGDLGWWLIGNDCAAILRVEWTLPEVSD